MGQFFASLEEGGTFFFAKRLTRRVFASSCAPQAVKRDPTNAAYRNNLAAALTKIGDFNAAKAACEKVRAVAACSLYSRERFASFSPAVISSKRILVI